MATAAVRVYGLIGPEAFKAFREYTLRRDIEATEINLRGWDLAHNNQAIKKSFGATDKELIEQALLLNYRRFLDTYSKIYISGGMKGKKKVGLRSIRTFIGPSGEKIRTFIDDVRVTQFNLGNEVKRLSFLIGTATERMMFFGATPKYIKKVVTEALDAALNRKD